ncbi:hypothetical protein QE152_g8564 [Popillia japonica]|uniref:Uncharacterized protein n=1 Tax=Popillia japonica TaxID=7064 RepID=A0AAW1MCN4_POPJA
MDLYVPSPRKVYPILRYLCIEKYIRRSSQTNMDLYVPSPRKMSPSLLSLNRKATSILSRIDFLFCILSKMDNALFLLEKAMISNHTRQKQLQLEPPHGIAYTIVCTLGIMANMLLVCVILKLKIVLNYMSLWTINHTWFFILLYKGFDALFLSALLNLSLGVASSVCTLGLIYYLDKNFKMFFNDMYGCGHKHVLNSYSFTELQESSTSNSLSRIISN